MDVELRFLRDAVDLRVLRGPLVLGHVRALAGETVRVSAAVAQQVLAERPGWVEVLGDRPDLFLGPPVPASAEAEALIARAPGVDEALLKADPALIEERLAQAVSRAMTPTRKGSRK